MTALQNPKLTQKTTFAFHELCSNPTSFNIDPNKLVSVIRLRIA